MKKTLSALSIAVLLISVLLSSCSGEKHTADEMREIAEPLIEKSAELNVIYFGEGLPLTVDAAEAEAFYSSFDTDVESISYHPVDKSCGYESIDDIKNATLEVFTEDYSDYLFTLAFTGISDTVNDGVGDKTETSSYARYLEQSGMLTARIDLASEALTLGRVYHMDELEIVREKDDYVLVSIPTELDGKECDVELKLVLTDDGWRLDTPTY
jgi:hypothetical protein